LKELRPGTVRILFAFDPWYRQAIPIAEQRYEVYMKERQAEEGGS
jgi:hypothetical protein